jgi:hypothetical protein
MKMKIMKYVWPACGNGSENYHRSVINNNINNEMASAA